MPITFQLTSKAPVSDILVPYQYYIWHITDNKLGAAYVQLAQFQFINADDTTPDMGVTSPVLLDGHATPQYETTDKLVNGSTSNGNKFLDLNFISGGSRILFSFNEPTTFIGYKWKTANDEPARDPKSWVMYGSNNEEDWDVIHTVTNFISTNDREVFNTPFKYKNIVAPLETKVTFTANYVAQTNDGTTELRAGISAYQIKTDFPTSEDGLYWIQNPNINSGSAFQIYADMTTDGGGWTLLLLNNYSDWNYAGALLRNQLIPPTSPNDRLRQDQNSNGSDNYSIVGWADYIKSSSSGFQYMIDAYERGHWGAIWTANGTYSFVNPNNTQTDITINTKFDNWNYDNGSIEQHMPWYSNSSGILTTSEDPGGEWWGTLIASSGWSPAPYMGTQGMGNPGIIWYWVR